MSLKYCETETDLQAAQLREYLGRAYAASLDPPREYPIAPDTWPGMNDAPPLPPPPDSYTLYYADPVQKPGGGGVFRLDDTAQAIAGATITLSDGNDFSFTAQEAVDFGQLSTLAQQALEPPNPFG